MSPHLVEDVAVQLRVLLRLEDMLQYAELRLFLGLEVIRIIQHFAVAVAEEDVGRVPSCHAKLTDAP